MPGEIRPRTLVRLTVWLGILCFANLAQAQIQFNLPSQPLATALLEVARLANMNVLYDADTLDGLKAPALKGEITADEALSRLLAGTGLHVVKDGGHTVRVVSDFGPRRSAVSPNLTHWALAPPDSTHSADPDASGVSDSAPIKTSGESHDYRQQLDEVVVTGSRLIPGAGSSAQAVRVYGAEQIQQSGQLTVSDFLNALPEVSTSTGESGAQTPFGSTTVRLRGLPVGTTLVLVNGRRVETSGTSTDISGGDFFDLNNIPLGVVDRIEVLPEGSSAVYGSDAIAGVVNVLLKKNFDGVELNARGGWASDLNDAIASLAVGHTWERGSASLIASYQRRGEINTAERAITRDNDYTAYGGPNANLPLCHPGNIFSVDDSNLPGLAAPYAAVPAGFNGTPSIQEFKSTAGTLNTCPAILGQTLIPATRRAGVFLQGNFRLTESVELFAEIMYSHNDQYQYGQPPGFFGIPAFQVYVVPASNAFNPFGVPVGIADTFPSVGRTGQFAFTDFFRPLFGARGNVFGRWFWELSGWSSQDSVRDPAPLIYRHADAINAALASSDPATALNPFVAGPQGSPGLLQSLFSQALIRYFGRSQSLNGYVRGPLFDLPAGSVQAVLGGEYDRNSLAIDNVLSPFAPPNQRSNYSDHQSAVFAEVRLPLLASRARDRDLLAVTIAGRHDAYSDFGSKNTPQLSADWRPLPSVLIRGTFAKSFKAPPLPELQGVQTSFTEGITDPLTGQTSAVTVVTGGNPQLAPETGQSTTIGFTFSNPSNPQLQLKVMYWDIRETNAIQQFPLAQTLVDNETLFPNAVVRAPSCPSGPPCPITTVFDTYRNFGEIDVRGFDYALSYRAPTRIGSFDPSLSVTQIYRYSEAFAPASARIDATSVAQDSGNWAPRWKGTAALGWQLGGLTTHVAGRYVGKYQDYDSTRVIGNIWLVDANARYDFGRIATWPRALARAHLEVGGVNLFNRLPQYSAYESNLLGYDPAQADVRGRFYYVGVGAQF